MSIAEVVALMEEPTESNLVLFDMSQCPMCHRDFTGKRASSDDLDIVTHMAVCSSEHGEKAGRFRKRVWRWESVMALIHFQFTPIVLGGFLTEAHAQRKWFVRLASYISFGKYKLGSNNGNILVQDRTSGQVIEEKMPTYIRLGIRLLYQSTGTKEGRPGALQWHKLMLQLLNSSSFHTAVDSRMIRRVLRSMTIKQGRKFNDPASQKDIMPFIRFHKINLGEALLLPSTEDSVPQQRRDSGSDDGSSSNDNDEDFVSADQLYRTYANFNEFFYRKLKPNARKLEAADDPSVVVSPADCRCNVFETVDRARELWIKGEQFTLGALLGDEEAAKAYEGGRIGIFRLAPQDYHRFHMPGTACMRMRGCNDGLCLTHSPIF